jgi:hypothetical protein
MAKGTVLIQPMGQHLAQQDLPDRTYGQELNKRARPRARQTDEDCRVRLRYTTESRKW